MNVNLKPGQAQAFARAVSQAKQETAQVLQRTGGASTPEAKEEFAAAQRRMAQLGNIPSTADAFLTMTDQQLVLVGVAMGQAGVELPADALANGKELASRGGLGKGIEVVEQKGSAVAGAMVGRSEGAQAALAHLDTLGAGEAVRTLRQFMTSPPLGVSVPEGEKALLVAKNLAVTENGFAMVEESTRKRQLLSAIRLGGDFESTTTFHPVTVEALEELGLKPADIDSGLSTLLDQVKSSIEGQRGALNGSWRVAGKKKCHQDYNYR